MNKKKLVAVFTMLCFLFTLMPMAAFAGVDTPNCEVNNTGAKTINSYYIYNGSLTEGTTPMTLDTTMKFKALETKEEAANGSYAKWLTDFYITINDLKSDSFEASGCYLAGEYGNYGWIQIPLDNVKVENGVTYPVVSNYDANLTYENVCDYVKEFACGIYLNPEIVAANPDMTVTLELCMANPASNERYVVNQYVYDPVPELPTATVTEIENEDLTFALNFKADDVTEEQLAYYGDWYADFELTVNKDVTFNAEGGANGYLSGSYEAWNGGAWVNVPFEDVTLEANKSLKIMEYAAELMGQSGLKLTYNDVYTSVKDFDCGVFFEEEFLAANPDLVVTLELRMYNPEDETESYVIGETYEFTAPDSEPEKVTVTFDTSDGTAINPVEVEVNGILTKPADPTKDGYTFAGWYTDETCTTAYDFNTPVTESFTLYAKWTKNDVETESKPSTGSSGGGFSGVYNYPVALTSDDDYSVKSDKNNAVKGETVTITVTPENGKEVDEVIVTDEKGNKLTVTKVGENKYTFVMPASKVNVAVTMQDADNEKLVLKIGSNTYHKDGVAGHTDVTPVIKDGRTLVPIRVIVEALGGTVDWDDATRTVTITIDGKVLKLVIDKEIPGYGTGAIIIEGRTMVPIRYISEYVGYDVEWIAATQQVVIDINN